MKKIGLALVIALMVLTQAISLVSAAPTGASNTAISCGDTYTVQKGDWLSKIAANCGVTLSSVVALNPQIKNINLIYPGQVIRLSGAVAIPSTSTGGTTTTGPATTTSGSVTISINRTMAQIGDDITVSVAGFPKNTAIDYRVGQAGKTFSVAYDGATDDYGKASRVIEIPSGASNGEKWVVVVVTTNLTKPISATSAQITIGASTTTGGTTTTPSTAARVALSSTSGQAGKSITVYVTGFPKNANVDYRIGEVGKDYTMVVDGVMDSTGSDDMIFTLPATAAKGQTWVVTVTTTDLVKATIVSSPKITIDN